MLVTEERPDWLPDLWTGERLVWRGRASRQLIVFRLSDAVHFVTGGVLLWSGLNMNRFFEGFGTLGDEPSSLPPLFGFVAWFFVISGLFEVAGRHVVNYVRRARTSYALTTRRAFIHSGVFHPVTRQRPVSSSDRPEFRVRGDGSGTIIFDRPEPRRRWSGSSNRGRDLVESVSAGLDGFQFFGVADAERVQMLLADDRDG